MGEIERAGSTVKLEVAELGEPLDSVPVIVYVPWAVWATVKVHDHCPRAETTDPTVQLIVLAADQVTVTEAPVEYPFPLTVAELPTMPLVGETDSLGPTVNGAEAVLLAASVAVTLWAP